jgi:hypothetical protein
VAVVVSAAGKGSGVDVMMGEGAPGLNGGAVALTGVTGAAGSLQTNRRSPVGSIRGMRQLAQPVAASAQHIPIQNVLEAARPAVVERCANMSPLCVAVRYGNNSAS